FASTLIAYRVGGRGAAADDRALARLQRDLESSRIGEARLKVDIRTLRERQEREAYFGLLAQAEKAVADGQNGQARALLLRCPEGPRHWEWHYLFHRTTLDGPTRFGPFAESVTAVAFSPDGRRLAAAGGRKARPEGPRGPERVVGEVKVWELP